MNGRPPGGGIGHLRLFWEWFKIALFVVGGGYAIIMRSERAHV